MGPISIQRSLVIMIIVFMNSWIMLGLMGIIVVTICEK